MYATFKSNPYTTIDLCYNSTNIGIEQDINTFYNELSFQVQHTTKNNVLIISRGVNDQIEKDRKNKFSRHNSLNRIGEYLVNFSLDNWLACLKIKFQKRERRLQQPSKAQWYYIY